jgi:phage terminase large subunit
MIRVQLPDWSELLFEPARYKVVYGGRGSAKSWSFATALLLSAAQQRERVLCAREIQKSIDDSVKRLLDDRISFLERSNLIPTGYFISNKKEIRCPATDSLFIFSGLRSNPESTIKSMEGLTKCWVEEAHTVSRASLSILTPTVRTEDSELWFSFNPKFKTDPVYVDYVLQKPPPGSKVIKVNFNRNPWFPKVLHNEMMWDRRHDFDKFRHVWRGEPVVHSASQIYNGVWREDLVPDPPAGTTFYYGADWGFARDPAALLRCWIDGRTLYIDREAYGVGVEIDELPQLFRSVEGAEEWKIRSDPSRPETISYLNRKGFNIVKAYAGKGSIEDGISYCRSFDIVVDPRCKHTIDELSLYSYKTDKLTQEVLPIIVDKNNHLMDCLRYAVSERMRAVKHKLVGGPAGTRNDRELVPDAQAA